MNSGAIKARARELGFDKAGVARAGAVPVGQFLNDWLARGFHGEMEYMARRPERRLDLAQLLQGARSVVCVAKNYFAGGPPGGCISRYARGADYHDVIGEKLAELARFIGESGGRAVACVDTGAILEKAWARAAGLGWQGMHSILVTRDFGSWVVLGEVVTDLDLEPDAPHPDGLCGTCRRCMNACPTGAIVAPCVVDARKCIAYLTIENRGPIPEELRPRMGRRVFGCDACQDACPWNRFAKETSEPAFRAASPSLEDIQALTREEFPRRFGGSPVNRAGYEGFLRNVEAASGRA